jgi:hypothetical protein
MRLSPDAVGAPIAVPPHAAAPMLCPDCGTPREVDGEFRGVCRYNFETGQSYRSQPAASPASQIVLPAPADAAAAPVIALPAAPATEQAPFTAGAPKDNWIVIIDFDPSLDAAAGPATATPRPQLTFPLELPEMLIGRRNGNAHPEIPVDDEAVSSRHARIYFTAGGKPMLLDLASTNGTTVNGIAVVPGAPTALAAGDQIVIGRLTRITIKTR